MDPPLTALVVRRHLEEDIPTPVLLTKGTLFGSQEEFMDALQWYMVEQRQALRVVRSSSERKSYGCIDPKCTFEINARQKDEKGTFRIVSINLQHTCDIRKTSCEISLAKAVSADWILDRLHEKKLLTRDTLIDDGAKRVKDMVKLHLRLDIHYHKAQRIKEKHFEAIYGDCEATFNYIQPYFEKIAEENPGTDIYVESTKEDESFIFHRLYLCLKPCKEAFNFMRPVVYITISKLKSIFGGAWFTACGIDGNGLPILLASAISSADSEDNWRFFLEQLSTSFPRFSSLGESLIIVKDRRKTPDKALVEIFPEAQYIYRSKPERVSNQLVGLPEQHTLINTNNNTTDITDELESSIHDTEVEVPESISSQSNVNSYASNLDRITVGCSRVYDLLKSFLNEPRETVPLNLMVSVIRWTITNFDERRRLAERRETSTPDRLTLHIEKKLENLTRRAAGAFEIVTSGWTGEVEKVGGNRRLYVQLAVKPSKHEDASIDLQDEPFQGFCDCGEYQENLYPCLHACALIHKLQPLNDYQLRLRDFAHEYYTNETLRKTYQEIMRPVPLQFDQIDKSKLTPAKVKKRVGRPRRVVEDSPKSNKKKRRTAKDATSTPTASTTSLDPSDSTTSIKV